MLRIHFDHADLGRVRLATRPDAMWETVLSLHQLISPVPFFTPWKRVVRRALRDAGLGAEARLLGTIAPLSSYFPDFLTPPGHTTVVDAGIDLVLSTGKHRLRADIDRLAQTQPRSPVQLEDVGAGRPSALRRLGTALRRYHAVALAPYTSSALACANRDTAQRSELFLEQGSEAVLDSFRPMWRWRYPVLEVSYPVTRDLRLTGRGLHLIPSFFCHRHPIGFADPELPPVLIYPVVRSALWIPRPSAFEPDGRALEELVGATRAAALRALDTGHTTTALAAQLCVSASAASRHASALRHAGLVTTERLGPSVLHTRTPLGTALVHGA